MKYDTWWCFGYSCSRVFPVPFDLHCTLFYGLYPINSSHPTLLNIHSNLVESHVILSCYCCCCCSVPSVSFTDWQASLAKSPYLSINPWPNPFTIVIETSMINVKYFTIIYLRWACWLTSKFDSQLKHRQSPKHFIDTSRPPQTLHRYISPTLGEHLR